MSTVKACYYGSAFVSVGYFDILKGTIVNISFLQEETISPMIAEKLVAFRQLTNEIHEINKSEPLAQEFDEIIANRVNVLSLFDLTCKR